jgi:hypothetical protein
MNKATKEKVTMIHSFIKTALTMRYTVLHFSTLREIDHYFPYSIYMERRYGSLLLLLPAKRIRITKLYSSTMNADAHDNT